MPLDVTDHDGIRSAVAHTETEMGTIDILINNSGVATTQKLVEVTPEDFDYIFDVNMRGAFFVAQEVGKRMIARAQGAAPGTFTGGRIVNIASMAGLRVLGRIGVYAMSKAAVIHMTQGDGAGVGPLRHQRQRHLPGLHRHRDQPPPVADRVRARSSSTSLPRKRIGSPNILDAVLMMLCANESHFVNGAVISADDGFGL